MVVVFAATLSPVVTDVFSPGPVVLMFSGSQELEDGTEMAASLTIPGPTLQPR